LHFSEANWRSVRIDTCWGSLQALLQTRPGRSPSMPPANEANSLNHMPLLLSRFNISSTSLSTSQVDTSWCRRQLGAGGESRSQDPKQDVWMCRKFPAQVCPDKLQLPKAPGQIKGGKFSEIPHVHMTFLVSGLPTCPRGDPSQAASPVEKSCCASRRAGGGSAPNQLRGLAGRGVCPELEGSSIRPASFFGEEVGAPAKQWRKVLKNR
jgi:hypothetical protein